MKKTTKNYFIFAAVYTLLLVYFYFNQHFFTINLYGTYHHISYFHFVLPLFIMGTLYYLIKIATNKLKNRIEQSNDKYSKFLLFVLAPNSYFKFKERTKNYIIFLAFGILLLAYLYFGDFYYFAIYSNTNQLVSYYYFVLPILIFGTIFYFIKYIKEQR
ncbi:hypothetical protein FLA105535_03023 [Flavobacterium bizetiae]|uniref:hypothetical protein n=1 Tax=Flavobacterium bizetiae TaxID=2704140 RepID=UPI00190A2276|nr:hypothetical protein [Flavobacterium bizetiae]CAD5343025.1 hypothetical protein FLA105535_03023 [Flavobacterium bizetiae]